MDLVSVYRDQLPFESDLMLVGRNSYEGLGRLVAGLIGTATQVARLPATPTSPASMAVLVGTGEIYSFQDLTATPQGQLFGTGGIPADNDPDHKIMKQGVLLDPVTFAVTAPVTVGQSINYLIQAAFVELEADVTTAQFYNTANPNAPNQEDISPARLNRCVLSLKAGTAATTGAQTTPAADAGNVPVWVVTVPYGATTITGGNIAEHPSAPFISVSGGGGGGGSGLPPWATINAAGYTATPGDRILADMSAGAFTITLPGSPADGAEFTVRVNKGATNNLTLGRNGKNTPDVNGSPVAANMVINQNNVEVKLVFSTTMNMWTGSE